MLNVISVNTFYHLYFSYPSPIQDTKFDTDKTYNEMLDLLLQHVRHDKCIFIAGSHNEQSISHLISKIHLHAIPKNKVLFGQLYGLCDPTTLQLSMKGYTVLKAIAWGPVESVLPYLARRAQENTGVLGSSTRELDLLKLELKRRMVHVTVSE